MLVPSTLTSFLVLLLNIVQYLAPEKEAVGALGPTPPEGDEFKPFGGVPP